jgi:lipopolysaccharide/colanic/teichoic acid biosynthesis glycosyltransferase
LPYPPTELSVISAFRRQPSPGLDLTLAALALVVLLPFMALILVLITIDSPGPIFCDQASRRSAMVPKQVTPVRLNTFNFYKFRTMVCSADPSSIRPLLLTSRGRVETPNPNCAE